jgi:hypothetical protein
MKHFINKQTFEIANKMRLWLIGALVATISLVSSFTIDENLSPEDAWNAYNNNKRPLNKRVLMADKELTAR